MNDWKSSIHPGEILADELEEIDLTISQLAQKIYVSPETLYHILQGDANLTGDIALYGLQNIKFCFCLLILIELTYHLDLMSLNQQVLLILNDRISYYSISYCCVSFYFNYAIARNLKNIIKFFFIN
jgi:plasmid maintenance system antidote protein VapI